MYYLPTLTQISQLRDRLNQLDKAQSEKFKNLNIGKVNSDTKSGQDKEGSGKGQHAPEGEIVLTN